ncbi:serine hydrolase domain-containing protein [Thermodesulfobacteriota bacterium]
MSEKPELQKDQDLETHCASEDLPMAEPEEVGISSERLSRIRPVMERYINLGLVPGVVSLVARRGKVVYLDAIGFQDVEAKIPSTTDTIFRIASMTKPISSVALMMLYEEGHFLLSDPIEKWIPEFSNPEVVESIPPGGPASTPWRTVPAARPINIRHLLTHTAGLANPYRGVTIKEFEEACIPNSPEETIGDFVKRYAKLPLNFHPGEAWEYSRATCVVGHLVELLSDMTLDEFFHERIFGPLGMVDTHFFLPEDKLGRFAASYTFDEDGNLKLTDPPTKESRFVKEPHVYFIGSGGLVSTISDYYRFDQMMLNGGELDGHRLLSRKTVDLMTRNHTGDLPLWLPGPWAGFGLGYAIARDTESINTLTSTHKGPLPWSIGSFTWGGAFCTYHFIDPVEDLIGVVMTQVRPYTHLNIRQDFVGLVNQAVID